MCVDIKVKCTELKMAEVQVNRNQNNTAKECERDFGAAVTAKAQQLQRALRWAGFQSVSRIYHIVVWGQIIMLMIVR